MKQERFDGIDSKHRENDVATNLKMWQTMIKGAPAAPPRQQLHADATHGEISH